MIFLNSQTEKFLQLYKQLEFEGRRIYFPNSKENESIIGRLFTVPQLKKFKEDLDYCRVVRNFLTHNPKVGGVYPIIPSYEMIKLLEKCLNVISNPPKALDFAVPIERIYTASPDSKLSEVVKVMNSFTYTHIPIIDGERLIGVFSENTVFTYMCYENSITINEDTEIRQFQKYIPLDEHLNEYFAFLPETAYLYEVQELFKYTPGRKKLLTVIYITKNGKRDEEIIAMITPWDLL